MLTTIILLAATAAPVEWELRVYATSNNSQAAESVRLPTRQRCEAFGRAMVAFLEDGEPTKGLGVRVRAVCTQVSASPKS